MSPLRLSIVILMVVLGLLAGILVACWGDRWVMVESGDYVAVEARRMASADPVLAIERVSIDRPSGTAIFTLTDGSLVTTEFVPRDRAVWPAGCPSNVRSTRMEVLDLQMEELVIGPTTYARPVLVRDCPENPPQVVLRSDGEIGGGGSACLGTPKCVSFTAEECVYTGPPTDQALPRSMKGYELYSWNVKGQWRFTLITGTNRLKTLAEVTSCRNMVEEDWIKITVRGVNDLNAILALLPQGSHVGWGGRLDPAGSGSRESGERLELPPRRILNGVRSYGSELGIELDIIE